MKDGKRRGWWLIGATALVGIVAWRVLSWQDPSDKSAHADVGSVSKPGLAVFSPSMRRPAPDVHAPTLAGGDNRLAAERGHVVVINIWGPGAARAVPKRQTWSG